MNIEGEDPLINLVLLGQKFWLLDMLFIYLCVLILTNKILDTKTPDINFSNLTFKKLINKMVS